MIVADTHVHLYPFADFGRLLDGAWERLGAAAGGAEAVRVLMLTERYDCNAFETFASGSAALSDPWSVAAAVGDTLLRLARPDGGSLWLAAGHQLVTRERLEVLGLMMRAKPADGLDAADTVQAVLDAGGVPVFPWAPGKWLGTRGLLLDRLLDRFGPETAAVGDTSLRPIGWNEPWKMKAARARGFRVLCGSDPLPIAGEEAVAGTYATAFETAWPGERTEALLRELLLDPGVRTHSVGRRGWPWTVARRLVANHRNKKAAA